jgi:hypothetical protein
MSATTTIPNQAMDAAAAAWLKWDGLVQEGVAQLKTFALRYHLMAGNSTLTGVMMVTQITVMVVVQPVL